MSAVPKLRFKRDDGSDLPDWEKVTLREYSEFLVTNSLSRSELDSEGLVQNIHYGDIHTRFSCQYDQRSENTPYISNIKIATKLHKKNQLKRGDIVIADASEDYADIGKALEIIGISDTPLFAGLHTIAMRPDSQKFYVGFGSYLFQSTEVRKQIYRLAQGAKVLGLSKGNIQSLLMNLPPISEQQKIASFLSSVDKKIDLLRQKKDALELHKKGLMQKIFSQEIRFKQDDGSNFPDWEEVALNEIAKRSTEKNKDLELTLVLTNSAVQGVVIQTEYFDKSIANEANISGYYKIRKYDFVYNPRISSSAPVGPISQNLKEDGVMSPLYTIFRVEVQYQGFLSVYFKSSVWYDYMRSVANQGARHDRMNITTSDFMALPIDLPCAEEQKKIADFLSAIDAKIQNTSSQIEQMETFKKGLLQQMFV